MKEGVDTKITVDVEHSKLGAFYAYEMKIGEVAEIVGGFMNGRVIMRSYDGLVSLNQPGYTWPVSDHAPAFEVRVFPKGTKITLTI